MLGDSPSENAPGFSSSTLRNWGKLNRSLPHARLVQVIRTMGAHVLGRLDSRVVPTYVRQLSDGSYLAYLYPQGPSGKPLLVRIIEYTIEDPKRVI